jgi:hypothetical protein
MHMIMHLEVIDTFFKSFQTKSSWNLLIWKQDLSIWKCKSHFRIVRSTRIEQGWVPNFTKKHYFVVKRFANNLASNILP